jgi:signal transduction histidine kinase
MQSSDVLDRAPGVVAAAASERRTRTSSLRRRLTLLICALLGILGAVFSWMAYREVERALLVHGHERMVAAARQVSDLLAQSIAPRNAEVLRLAQDAEIRQLVQATQTGEPAAPPESLRALANRPQPAGIVLQDAQGRVTHYLPAKSDTWQAAPASSPSGGAPREGLSELRTTNGQVHYRATAKVTADGSSQTIGYVSLERSLAASPITVLIGRLIGSGATIKLGNASRDVWTDLSTPVAAPPAADLELPARYVNAQGDARLGTAVAVTGTPWVLWAEMSERALLSPAHTLSRRVAPISLLIMVVGTLAIYWMSARITKPLNEAAAAADGLAAGDYSRRVDAARSDEIGRLGHAFNIMAERVGDAHHALEARVAARTSELEDALRALQDAQAELVKRERLAMLGQLASSVGHELRNPLGVMTNAVYYLKMIQNDAPPTVTEYLGILQHQIGLAEKIVGDLLDFARLRPPQVQTVSVRQLVDDQLARLGPLDRIAVRRENLDDLPPVTVDPVQMGQVLLNLFTNADQAMEGGGVLTVRGSVEQGTVVLDVADTGGGIPAGIMEKIFEPLFTTKARGIGLGLAVSKSLAKANGVELKVASQVGKGATFSLLFSRKASA